MKTKRWFESGKSWSLDKNGTELWNRSSFLAKCGTSFFLANVEQVWLIGTRQLAGLLAGSKRFMKRISIYQEKEIYLSGEGDLSIRRRGFTRNDGRIGGPGIHYEMKC